MIYFVAKNIGLYGGAAVVAMDVIDSLVESGIEFETICMEYKVPEERDGRLSSLKRRKMAYVPEKDDYSATGAGSIRFLLKRAQNTVENLALTLHLYRNPPELMIFNGYRPSTMAVIDRYSGVCKTVHIVHVSPNYLENFEDFISLDELIDVYKKADSLVFVSDECRKAWLEYNVIDEDNAFYIPNCAKEDEANSYLQHTKAETREKLGLNPESFYLVNVASVKERKGQDLIIDAASELKKIAPNLEILIVGPGGGKFIADLKKTVSEEKLDFIQFLGHQSNAMEYVYASDLFVLPSRAEAFPLVLLEAMILKTPMIGSNVDGVPEMIKDGKTGFLFESDNTADLVQAFEKMYRSKEDRNQYAEQASKKYWDNFSKEQFTRRYASLIEQVLKD